MLQKKICMLGGTAVGKTSLVARYVRNLFSDKYHSSIGVKVDKKVLTVEGQEMTLLLWDIYGDDEFQRIRTSYLRGAAGYLLVVDGTRRSTLDRALDVKKSVEEAIGPVPFVLVVNKADLVDNWDLPEDLEDGFRKQGWEVIRSSAKTGMGVEEAFSSLAAKLVAA